MFWEKLYFERNLRKIEEKKKEEEKYLLSVCEKRRTDSYSKKNIAIFLQFNCFLRFLFFGLVFSCVSYSIDMATSSSSLAWFNDTSYPLYAGEAVSLAGQDHCIYVFGGQNSVTLSKSYKFNSTAGFTGAWTPIEPLQMELNEGTGCIANDRRFFIFGMSSSVQVYNATNNSWSIITPSIPSRDSIDDMLMSCAVDSNSGLMYLTGGITTGTRFYSYNVSSNNITDLYASSSAPFNLQGQGSFVNNGKLFVFGGDDDSTGNILPFTYIYDIANNSWSTGRNMTQAAAYFGYATDGSRFYAIGGLGNAGFLNYTQVYDISSGVWSIDDGIVYSGGIDYNAAVFLDGNLHSIGGALNGNWLSVHRVVSLCGVYTFSGPCNDENECTFNDTCQSNGQCIGISTANGTLCNSTTNKCLSNTSCSNGKCTGQSKFCPNSTCDPSTGQCLNNNNNNKNNKTSSSSSSTSISPGDIVGIVIAVVVFVGAFAAAGVFLLKYKRGPFTNHDKQLEPCPPCMSDTEAVYSKIEGPTIYRNSVLGQSSSISTTFDKDSYVLQMSKMEIKRKIGEGAFGSVFLGIFNRTEVAIKQLSKTNISEEDIKEFMAEADLMKNLPVHPNVVLFRGVTLPPDPISIVTDFCNGGSLVEYLRNNPKIPISEKLQFIKDIAKGMLHLHCGVSGKEVIHRDLAARNILLRNGVAVIMDFGLSRVKVSVEDYQKTQNNVGPLKWMSPESLVDGKYSTKSDVFSFAVVIYEIITQELPWKDLNPSQAVVKVSNGQRMTLPESCECPPALKELMEKCWAQDPADRPDFEKICEMLEGID